ncbi:MAG: PilZ domain-containing protein, partial [Candidatus Eremiobacterota bacterium]
RSDSAEPAVPAPAVPAAGSDSAEPAVPASAVPAARSDSAEPAVPAAKSEPPAKKSRLIDAPPEDLEEPEFDPRSLRRVARIKCDYASAASGPDGQTFEVRISDLAIEGAGVSASTSLERGQVITLNQPESIHATGRPVQGRVMWCQPAGGRTEAGLMFIDPPEAMSESWVVHLLDHLTEDQNQNLFEDNTLAQKPATLKVRTESKDGSKGQGRMLNLGLGSAKVSLDREFRRNTNVDIILGPYQELEALLLPGQVLSVRDDDEDDRWVHEIRFLDKSPHQTSVLGRYVLALLAESDA